MIRCCRKEPSLFYTADELSSSNVTFYDRLAKAALDWDHFARELRWAFCENNGRPTDPTLYLKCFFVGYIEDIERETELAARLSDSISIRKFLFGTLSEAPPDHSSLSRVRRAMAEKCDFDSVLNAVVKILESYGMVGGEAVAMDTALVPSRARRCFASDSAAACTEKPEPCPAGASESDSLLEPSLLAAMAEPPAQPEAAASSSESGEVERTSGPDCGSESLLELEEHFAKPKKDKPKERHDKLVPSSYDPDAHPAKKPGYQARPSYKIGVAADYKSRVILAADAYPASMGEGQPMRLLFSGLVRNLGLVPKYAVADAGMDDSSFHATVELFGATPVTSLQKNTSKASGFGKERFFYDEKRNVYICPAGQDLKCKSSPDALRQIYVASMPICDQCPLKLLCYGTRKNVKDVSRTFDEASRDRVVAAKTDPKHNELLAYRKAVVEPIFADFKGYGGLAMIWTEGLPCAQMKAKIAAFGWNIKLLLKRIESGNAAKTKPRTPRKPTEPDKGNQTSGITQALEAIQAKWRRLAQIAASSKRALSILLLKTMATSRYFPQRGF